MTPEAFRAELDHLNDVEVLERHSAARQALREKEAEEARERRRRYREEWLATWCRRHEWSLMEAAQLLLGREPGHTPELMSSGERGRWEKRYNDLRTTLGNAVSSGDLRPKSRGGPVSGETVLSATLLRWADLRLIDVPEDLRAAVAKFGAPDPVMQELATLEAEATGFSAERAERERQAAEQAEHVKRLIEELAEAKKPKGKRGRPPKYEWHVIEAHARRVVEAAGGLPSPLDRKGWRLMSDLVNAISDRCSEKGMAQIPSATSLETYLHQWFPDLSTSLAEK